MEERKQEQNGNKRLKDKNKLPGRKTGVKGKLSFLPKIGGKIFGLTNK